MRFVGLVLVIVGAATAYFMAYKGLTIDQARTRLASLLNLPGLKPPVATSSARGSGSGFNGATAVAGGGGGGGGGGSW